MNPKARLFCAALVVVAIMLPAAAEACKYSVRDVGFVHLANASYQLVLIEDVEATEAIRAEREVLIRKSLVDTNVSFSVVVPAKNPDHTILKNKATPTGLWVMGPGERIAPLAVPAPGGTASWGVSEIEAFVDSPARREIGRHLTNGLGVVVVIEGADPVSNRKAQKLAEGTIGQITEVLGKLEKPTKQGPGLVILKADESERWLRWGLGESLDAPAPSARVAVVFGQFRRAGKILADADLDPVNLFSLVAVLGYSCECNLDRASLFGPSLPHRWDASQRKRVNVDVGFDPLSSQVRAEVNAILAKQPLIEAGEFRVSYEQLMLGFKETPLEEEDRAAPSRTPPNETKTVGSIQTTAPTQVVETPSIPADRTRYFVGVAIALVLIALVGIVALRRK